MGGFLDAPIKDKNPDPGSNENFYWGACAMQGWRSGMEDSHICQSVEIEGSYGNLFGVFDGHGGKEVAEYARENFKKEFIKNEKFKQGDYKLALEETFMKIDDILKNETMALDTGCTACVVFITKDKYYCANSGDSRAIVCQTGNRAFPLSEDHKPNNMIELTRIQAAGHSVMMDRVDGELALSRALGDHQFKDNKLLGPEAQAVTAFPDVYVRPRNVADEYVFVACDGIWDCVSNEQCVQKLNEYIKELKPKPNNLCPPIEHLFEELCATSTADGIGTDNMTAVIVKFK